ncbi:MAG TPA: acyl-CoA thioesterase [Gammaproteobacteria bacterium]
MSSDKKQYVIHMEVRDYECDMADGVNNSVYFNYLEHARHSMLKAGGIDFAELARQRIGLVVLKAELDFIRSLMSGDKFSVHSRLFRKSKIRFEFHQEIYREYDNQLMLKAKILGASVGANGRPGLPAELESLIVPMCSELPEAVLA